MRHQAWCTWGQTDNVDQLLPLDPLGKGLIKCGSIFKDICALPALSSLWPYILCSNKSCQCGSKPPLQLALKCFSPNITRTCFQTRPPPATELMLCQFLFFNFMFFLGFIFCHLLHQQHLLLVLKILTAFVFFSGFIPTFYGYF